MALSGAGRGMRGLGAATTLCSAVFAYTLASLHMLGALGAVAFAVVIAGGLGLVGWSLAVSPRLARRRVERQLAGAATPRLRPGDPGTPP